MAASAASAASVDSAASTLTVASDGSAGFRTIGAALDALMARDDGLTPATIRIAPGEYRERLTIRRPNVTLEAASLPDDGDARDGVPRDGDVRVASGLGGFMPSPDGQGDRLGTFRTATVFVDAHDVTLRGLTIVNDAGPGEEVGQAIALYADGDRILVEDCVLLGHQDTLFTGPLPPREIEPGGFVGPKRLAPRAVGRQCYRRCLIAGDVDFIFGSARAWFEDCEIRSVGPGYVTAASTPQGEPYGYVFDHCRFTAATPRDAGCAGKGTRTFGALVPDGSVAIGRPWRDWARTVLVDCELGAHIRVDGWDDWGKSGARAHSCYAAIDPVGPGAAPMAWPRWVHTLDEGDRARFARDAVLDGWRPGR
ncbi:Pectinesterase A precursor [Bifidobacterium sp. DSM 109958]|uniref:Pectinesterase n=1 Tax=Bifidobacterium moraviense TaxID=2675323 RepID=A0A7Y0F4V3_9BIFI|nr:pectinesterase family protein [Bifidobacterium sp. DSM 109958]NMN01127.1 Pectinesterase A precursor [Bifidobacterium sp. DSM 109958]